MLDQDRQAFCPPAAIPVADAGLLPPGFRAALPRHGEHPQRLHLDQQQHGDRLVEVPRIEGPLQSGQLGGCQLDAGRRLYRRGWRIQPALPPRWHRHELAHRRRSLQAQQPGHRPAGEVGDKAAEAGEPLVIIERVHVVTDCLRPQRGAPEAPVDHADREGCRRADRLGKRIGKGDAARVGRQFGRAGERKTLARREVAEEIERLPGERLIKVDAAAALDVENLPELRFRGLLDAVFEVKHHAGEHGAVDPAIALVDLRHGALQLRQLGRIGLEVIHPAVKMACREALQHLGTVGGLAAEPDHPGPAMLDQLATDRLADHAAAAQDQVDPLALQGRTAIAARRQRQWRQLLDKPLAPAELDRLAPLRSGFGEDLRQQPPAAVRRVQLGGIDIEVAQPHPVIALGHRVAQSGHPRPVRIAGARLARKRVAALRQQEAVHGGVGGQVLWQCLEQPQQRQFVVLQAVGQCLRHDVAPGFRADHQDLRYLADRREDPRKALRIVIAAAPAPFVQLGGDARAAVDLHHPAVAAIVAGQRLQQPPGRGAALPVGHQHHRAGAGRRVRLGGGLRLPARQIASVGQIAAGQRLASQRLRRCRPGAGIAVAGNRVRQPGHPIAVPGEGVARQAHPHGPATGTVGIEPVPIEIDRAPPHPQRRQLGQLALLQPAADLLWLLSAGPLRIGRPVQRIGVPVEHPIGRLAGKPVRQATPQRRRGVDNACQPRGHRLSPHLQGECQVRHLDRATVFAIEVVLQAGHRFRQALVIAGRQQDQPRTGRGGPLIHRADILFDDQRGIGATSAEGGNRSDPGGAVVRPGRQLLLHPERRVLEVDVRVGLPGVQRRRQLAVLQLQQHLAQPGDAGGAFAMADIALDRADGAAIAGRAVAIGKHPAQAADLDGIAQRGAGAVRLDIADAAGVDR